MPLVKINNLLKYNNNLVQIQPAPAFVKLSYFNNYANSIDTPVYGEPYTISNNGNLIKNTMVINGITYPSLKLYGAGYWCKFDMGVNFEEVDAITIDCYSRLNVDNGWGNPCEPFCTWPAFWGDNWGYDRGSGVTTINNTVYTSIYKNPTLWDLYADNWYMRVNRTITRNVIFHLAYVYKWIDSNIIEQRIYVNGILQTIFRMPKSTLGNTIQNKIYMDTNYDYQCYVEFTQMAIRVGDYSINDGQEFPVPTEPYANW
jgi:hypothetical protein